MRARVLRLRPRPHEAEAETLDLATLPPVQAARLATDGEVSIHLEAEDRKALRRRVEDALRKTGTDALLVEVAARLGVRLD